MFYRQLERPQAVEFRDLDSPIQLVLCITDPFYKHLSLVPFSLLQLLKSIQLHVYITDSEQTPMPRVNTHLLKRQPMIWSSTASHPKNMKHQPAAISVTHRDLQTQIWQLFLFQSKSRRHQYFISLIWYYVMFPHVNKIDQNNYSVVMKKHDNKPAESREMRCMFSNRDSPTIALHWDGWNRKTAQTRSIQRLFNRLTKWLENCQMIGHSTILRNSNCQILSYCLKQLPQKQKFTDLALNQPSGKTRASLWIGDGEVTNSQRSSQPLVLKNRRMELQELLQKK